MTRTAVLSLLATTFFLGGWLLPFGLDPPAWTQPFIVIGKSLLFIFLFVWVRATLPRPRYDQLMASGWKVMLPLALANLVITGALVLARNGGGTP